MFFLPFLLFSVQIFPPNLGLEIPKTPLGWASDCASGLNISSAQCPNGFWLQEFLRSDCFCVRGLWALSSGLCDSDSLVLFGDGDCFRVQRRFKKLTFLGDLKSPFAPATFVSEQRKKHVFENWDQIQMIGNQSLTVLRVNPRSDFYYRLDSEPVVCIDDSRPNSTLSTVAATFSALFANDAPENSVSVIRVGKSPNFFELRENAELTHPKCKLIQKVMTRAFESETTKLMAGQGMYLDSGRLVKSVKKKKDVRCQKSCSQEDLSRKKRFLHNGQIDVKGYYGFSSNNDKNFLRGDFADDNMQLLLKEQNVRLIKAELAFVKDYVKQPDQQLTDKNFEFLRISRLLLNSVCPLSDVPELLTKTITRIFKYLTVERRDTNLYGTSEIDNGTWENIMDKLGSCYNNSMDFNFTYEVETRDCINSPERIWTEAPPAPTDPVINHTISVTDQPQVCTCFKNWTGVESNSTNNTCTMSSLKDDIQWKYYDESSSKDFVIETMWKMFQFAHFQCSQYFSEDGNDAALFHERVERFFSADVIYRWIKGGDNSRKVWEYFFMGYDLPSYARGIDTCLCAAQYWSDYPKPMVRPTIPVFRKRRSTESSGGRGHSVEPQCLHSPWDRVQISEDEQESC